MEEFKKIDWLPSIEDIVDNKFLNEKRLQAEGAMYQIMNGAFQDPFQDIRPRIPNPPKAVAPKKSEAKTNNNNKKKVMPKKRTKKKKKLQNKPTKINN